NGLLFVALAVILALWLPLGLFVHQWLHLSGWGALFWQALFTGLSFLACLPRGVLRGELRFASFGVNQVAEAAGRLACGLPLVLLGGQAAAAVGGYAAGTSIALLLGLWQIRDLRRV